MAAPGGSLNCEDYSMFQVTRITASPAVRLPRCLFCARANELVTLLITKDLHEFKEAHLSRDKAIKACIAQTSEVVGQLREQRAKDNENMALIKQLRKEQTKLKLMQSELNVEEVVNDRSLKVQFARCSHH
uniref:Protein MIX23 n=1 Tax=Neolamprologus brichardi TaxID=32507 RepID=A0A3Q4HUN3_NEOBR